MSKKELDEMGCAGIAGMQLPVGVKKRKKKVDEMLDLNPHVSVSEAIAFFSGLDEETSKIVESHLDENEYVKLAEMIKNGFAEAAIRAVIRSKMREIVKKKPGGGGYVLYAPNPGKRKEPKVAGEFPTKLGAKRAELQRFPPRDPDKLKSARKQVDKLSKDPKKAAEKEKEWGRRDDSPKKSKPRKRKPKGKKKESIESIVASLTESIFREEKVGSGWDEFVSKLSDHALSADKKFQGIQKKIDKAAEKVLKTAMGSIKSVMGSAGFDVNEKGGDDGSIEFTVGDSGGATEVGPFRVSIENGYPKISASSQARVSMTQADAERGKTLRAELMSVQEDSLDSMSGVASVIKKRDEYLDKSETKIDDFVSGLSSLEISLLKQLLVSKYRKLG